MILDYPFDSAAVMKKQKSLKRELKSLDVKRIPVKIAVLGGSTTNGIVDILELFLLNYGIEPQFYQSEYAQYWQDAMFGEELERFKPDYVFIHTSNRNITAYPDMSMSGEEVDGLLDSQTSRFAEMWDKLRERFGCPIVQNNMELPYWRLMGNKDAADFHGRVSFVNRFNEKIYDYAASHDNFYVHDINYLSACYGLDKWSDPLYWNMYKYALPVPAIPDFAFSLANIFKSLLGKNKKALALDLDNTLWGGVVGDDGVDGIAIGQEIPMGQGYYEFQQYVKSRKQLGVLLTVCSKNDEENAIAGLNHPDGALKPDDFTIIKANWEPKDINIAKTAQELNILPDSIVFADDNPAEREIVHAQLGVETPPMDGVENYIRTLDRGGYFEITTFSKDDMNRGEMYRANAMRAQQQASFADYGEYLKSLEMTAVIGDFEPVYLKRITQLTNKSNQFNLTTRRYTDREMEEVFGSARYIRLYGKLTDKFGDNGVVSVVIGEKKQDGLHIDLWLMSCRVLKRDMEQAMLDALVDECQKQGVETIYGYYYPTAKNAMVKELYGTFGFTKISENEKGDTVWSLPTAGYRKQNRYIKVEGE